MSGMPIRRQLRMGHKLREQRWHCSPGSVQRTNFTYQVDGVVGAPNFPILPTATLYARMLWYILYMNYGPELDVFQALKSVLSCQVNQSMLHSVGVSGHWLVNFVICASDPDGCAWRTLGFILVQTECPYVQFATARVTGTSLQ